MMVRQDLNNPTIKKTLTVINKKRSDSNAEKTIMTFFASHK